MMPIFLIVGPPAVGKSTTSHALAAHFPRSIHIPVDDLRDMVVSGLLLPGPEWSDALVLQIRLARQNAVYSALKYHEEGFAVVIDDFWDEAFLPDYKELFDVPGFHKVLLYPSQETANKRNANRSNGEPSAYIAMGIQYVYEQLSVVAPRLTEEGWLVVDTSDLDIEKTVDVILQKAAIHIPLS